MIHSDFDTNASREDILVDSERNRALVDWIAKAFVRAARQFSEQGDTLLSYEWPLFLPTTEGQSDRFWSRLDRKIQELVRNTDLFRSRKPICLWKLADLCILPSNAQLADGSPVLESATRDIYLSPRYSAGVREKLTHSAYGLEPLSWDQFHALLRKDLARDDSKMRRKDPLSEWHSVGAKLILKLGKYKRIDNIELLPLRNGKWITARDGPVYLPTIGDLSMPRGLNLQVLDPSAVANDARRELFNSLGAIEASFNTVRSSILHGFTREKFSNPLSHLRFLYQTSPPEMKLHVQEPMGAFEEVYVLDSKQKKVWPIQSDIYLLKESDPYGPHALLSDCDTISITYVDPILTGEHPPRPSEDHPTWIEWLHGCIGIRSRLRLLNLDNTELSEESSYVLSHKPSMFLGLLGYLWKALPPAIQRNVAIRQHIRELNFRSICNFRDEITLQQCWFPLTSLRETAEQYMENPSAFPFLQIEASNDSFDGIPRKWAFLVSDFQVPKDNDLSFLLDILRHIYYTYDGDVSLSTIQLQKLCDLYTAIYAKLLLLKDMALEKQNLMLVNALRYLSVIQANKLNSEAFEECLIYIPDDGPGWVELSECRWRGPTLTTKSTLHGLYGLYSRILGDDQMTSLELLFSRTLMIPDVSVEDVILELKLIKDEWQEGPELVNVDFIRELYRFLLDSENLDCAEYRHVILYQWPPVAITGLATNLFSGTSSGQRLSFLRNLKTLGGGTRVQIAYGPAKQVSKAKLYLIPNMKSLKNSLLVLSA